MEQATVPESVFRLEADERDTLVRHALIVIWQSGDLVMARNGEAMKRAAKHIGVMVGLLDQLGWSEDRPHEGPFSLHDELLPIEQIRVWVASRFMPYDRDAVEDAMKCQREDLADTLQRFGGTALLLARLNARADQRRHREGLRQPGEMFAPLDPDAVAAIEEPS